MTVLEWLLLSMQDLAEAGVDSPRRDSLILLEDLLRKDRSWVISHAEFKLNTEQVEKLDKLIKRRIKREPLAYIRGKAWFYGRFFEVNPSVMIPRPESESFINLLKDICIEERSHRFDVLQGIDEAQTKPYTKYGEGALESITQQNAKSVGGVSGSARKQADASMSIVDIGTGSGCLAITAKLEIPEAEVIAVDISEQALEIAKKNAKKHKVDIKFIESDLLSPKIPIKSSSTIVANLPYVPDNLITSLEITHEPKTALFSGKDGLDHYKKFWRQISNLKTKPGLVLIESLENQHKKIKKLTERAGYTAQKTEILVQLFTLR